MPSEFHCICSAFKMYGSLCQLLQQPTHITLWRFSKCVNKNTFTVEWTKFVGWVVKKMQKTTEYLCRLMCIVRTRISTNTMMHSNYWVYIVSVYMRDSVSFTTVKAVAQMCHQLQFYRREEETKWKWKNKSTTHRHIKQDF